MVVRSINARHHRAEFESLAALADDREDITVSDAWLSPSEARAQIELADCYVSLHRSEGFGLNLATAVATATPVLATSYSGNLDFMDDDTSWLVPYDVVEVGPGAAPYEEDQCWAQPRIDDAVNIMRTVVSNCDETRRRAALGQDRIRKTHSLDAAATSALTLMKSLSEGATR